MAPLREQPSRVSNPGKGKTENGAQLQDTSKASEGGKGKTKDGETDKDTSKSSESRNGESRNGIPVQESISVAPSDGIEKRRGRPLGSKNRKSSSPEVKAKSATKYKSSTAKEGPKHVQQHKPESFGGKTRPPPPEPPTIHHTVQRPDSPRHHIEHRGPRGCTYREGFPSGFGNQFGPHLEPMTPALGTARIRLELQAQVVDPDFQPIVLPKYNASQAPDPQRDLELQNHRDNVAKLLFQREEDIVRYHEGRWPAFPPNEDELVEEPSFFSIAAEGMAGNDPLGIEIDQEPNNDDWNVAASKPEGRLTVREFKALCQNKPTGNESEPDPHDNPSVQKCLRNIEHVWRIIEQNPNVPSEVLFQGAPAAAQPSAPMSSSSMFSPQQQVIPRPPDLHGEQLNDFWEAKYSQMEAPPNLSSMEMSEWRAKIIMQAYLGSNLAAAAQSGQLVNLPAEPSDEIAVDGAVAYPTIAADEVSRTNWVESKHPTAPPSYTQFQQRANSHPNQWHLWMSG